MFQFLPLIQKWCLTKLNGTTFVFTVVIKEFELNDTFASWVKMLPVYPRALVLTNYTRLSLFLLDRDTRQVCPLSPLLFAIAV